MDSLLGTGNLHGAGERIRFPAARLFVALAARSFQRHLAYRAAAIAGLLTNFFFGLVRIAILLALYGQRQEVAGMDVADVVTYSALTQAIIAYISLFGWYNLMETVYSGDVATDLLKPLNYYTFWLARDAGRAGAALLLRGILLMLAYALFLEMSYPASGWPWLALLLSAALSWLIAFSWFFMVNLAAFWTPYARGICRLGFVLAWLLSGFLMPLRFLPEWLVRAAYLTPFPHLVNTVVEIYLGLLRGPKLVSALLFQALWAMLLIAVGQIMLKFAVRRLVILGG